MLEKAKEKNSLIHTVICTTTKSEKVYGVYAYIFRQKNNINFS